ncbi:hypothetical protein Nstercoris_01250 [Nitrosomonas stercoris]|uniref:Uncharacterized protein n=1 Tax=Nitrosomonas stercoris TaxID=1444684 RepID=A0A4Y1YLL2_9PROT|nr:hypothetical protein Nstercoris_01250 [Nitrosomonas stercoris]
MSEREIQEQVDRVVADKQIIPSSVQSRRRKLLKSTVAIPVIMTLHSGAALARSSNMLTPVEEGDAVKMIDDGGGGEKYVCVHLENSLEGPPYDVGDIPTSELVDDPSSCVPGQGGILVSSAAYTSLLDKGMIPPEL